MYMGEKQHRIHRSVIALSFCGAAFDFGVQDRTKKNDPDDAARQEGWAPRQAYNAKALGRHE